MFVNSWRPRIPLPKGWTASVRSAVIHTIALAHYAIVYTRSWAADSSNARVRLAAKVERLEAELALRDEQQRITDIRMALIPPPTRPTNRRRIGWSRPSTPITSGTSI